MNVLEAHYMYSVDYAVVTLAMSSTMEILSVNIYVATIYIEKKTATKKIITLKATKQTASKEIK